MHVCFRLLAITVWQSLVSPPFRPLPKLGMLLGVLVYLVLEFGLWICLVLDRVLFPGYRRTEVKAPVFIIGNPRSGTTHLHRLMALDELQFTTFPAYEIFFPALTLQYLLAGLDRIDPYLGGPFRWLRERFEARVFAPRDALHYIRFNEPEEDDQVTIHKFASPIFFAAFNRSRALAGLLRFDDMPAEFRRDVVGFYKSCLQRHMYRLGQGRTLLSKNPTFPAKLRSIKEAFPDARFVYILRNPAVAIASIHSMLVSARQRWKTAPPTPEQTRRMIDTMCYMYQHAFEELERMPPGDYCIVEYEQLVADPYQLVQQIYAALGLPWSPAFEERLRQATAEAKRYRSRHVYSLGPLGVTAEEIRARLPFIYERFQFKEVVGDDQPIEPPPQLARGAA
uniref:Sulfotransferase n=1 Tax=Schlesneria paludicola TaxID=360056 RepID=A0A7C4QPF0_9PLAN